MLAPRELPDRFRLWNQKHGAPFGNPSRLPWPLKHRDIEIRHRGPFAFERNSTTRTYEYPWVHEQISQRGSGLQIVEIGGGLSGMQFVLAREGYSVVNVDPGQSTIRKRWRVDAANHARLATALRAPAKFLPTSIDRADLESHSADVVFSISALEHFTPEDLEHLARELPRILKPSGVLILTVDLFLDLQPFSDRLTNIFGCNIDVKNFLDRAGMVLEVGNPQELLGFEGFDPRAVMGGLAGYMVGVTYPALTQCLIARPG